MQGANAGEESSLAAADDAAGHAASTRFAPTGRLAVLLLLSLGGARHSTFRVSVTQVLSNTSNMCELQMLAKSCGKRGGSEFVSGYIAPSLSCSMCQHAATSNLHLHACLLWVQSHLLARMRTPPVRLSLICATICSGRAGQPH
jgi:hypothetical protein